MLSLPSIKVSKSSTKIREQNTPNKDMLTSRINESGRASNRSQNVSRVRISPISRNERSFNIKSGINKILDRKKEIEQEIGSFIRNTPESKKGKAKKIVNKEPEAFKAYRQIRRPKGEKIKSRLKF